MKKQYKSVISLVIMMVVLMALVLPAMSSDADEQDLNLEVGFGESVDAEAAVEGDYFNVTPAVPGWAAAEVNLYDPEDHRIVGVDSETSDEQWENSIPPTKITSRYGQTHNVTVIRNGVFETATIKWGNHSNTYDFKILDSTGGVIATVNYSDGNDFVIDVKQDVEFTVRWQDNNRIYNYYTVHGIGYYAVPNDGNVVDVWIGAGVLPGDALVYLEAFKNVSGDGAVLVSGQFEFAVYEGDVLVATGSNDEDGYIDFSAITYSQAGTHTYRVVETSLSGEGWTVDDAEYLVEVTVTYAHGGFAVVVTYPGNEPPVFDNYYAVEGDGDGDGDGDVDVNLEAMKYGKNVTGADIELTDGQFAFAVYDEDGVEVATGTNAADGSIEFSELTFDAPGTYTYTIKETSLDGNNWTIDDSEYTATVTVTEGEDGLYAEVAYNSAALPTFTNYYSSGGGGGGNEGDDDATVNLEAFKTVSGEGATLTNGQFAFAVYDEDGEVVATGSNDAEGKIVFTAIAYDEPGTYNYTIKETSAGGNGWTTDTTEYPVVVTVTENETGFTVEVDYNLEDDAIPTFNNSYSSTGGGGTTNTGGSRGVVSTGGGGGGGGDDGTVSRNVDLPDVDVPLISTPGTPKTDVEIDETETPLANLEMPKTGDNSLLPWWGTGLLFSFLLASLCVVFIRRQKQVS